MKTKDTTSINPENFTRIANDINGNPRYVCHYSHFIADIDRAPKGPSKTTFSQRNHKGKIVYTKISAWNSLEYKYKLALYRSRQLGGRKFNNKKFGGGIVFQSYDLDDLCGLINEIMSQLNKQL